MDLLTNTAFIFSSALDYGAPLPAFFERRGAHSRVVDFLGRRKKKIVFSKFLINNPHVNSN